MADVNEGIGGVRGTEVITGSMGGLGGTGSAVTELIT